MRRVRSALLSSRLGRAAKAPVRRSLAAVGYELVPTRQSEREFVLGLLLRQHIDTLIDVGANQGQYAERFRRWGFAGRMISFEPMGEAFARLQRNATADPMWEARMAALGAEPGSATLRVSANSVSSSLLPIGSVHVEAEPASRTVRTEMVPVSTLDAELAAEAQEHGYWLKLDVQGYEKEVLLGATDVLTHTRVVQCELSTRQLYAGQPSYLDVLPLLDEAGFTPVNIVPGFCDPATGEMLQFDIVAARAGGVGW